MVLFVLGWSGGRALTPGSAEGALRAVCADWPLLGSDRIESWASPSGALCAAWVAHDPAQVGGVRYVHVEDGRLALFAGRPVRWTGAAEADGHGVLDARAFLELSPAAAARLDGRFAAAACDDRERTLTVLTDPLGAYPLFETEANGATWVSNNAAALRAIRGSTELDPLALASHLGGGWSLTGDPWWAGVRRLPRGETRALAPGRSPERSATLPLEAMLAGIGAGLRADAAARRVVASTAALADWPGRPNVVPVTGGRDSRVVLAAALSAGFEFTATTGGADDDPDVVVARALCELAGIDHEPLAGDPGGTVWDDPVRMARLVAVGSSGTACIADAAGFPMAPRPGPLVLWHSGQGGEIARGYYGLGPGAGAGERALLGAGALPGATGRAERRLAERLLRAFLARRPGRQDPLGTEGRRLVRSELRRWVGELIDAGARPGDVPDLFYLLRRMGTWAGPSHGCVEPVKDTTSPLWSAALLGDLLAASAVERARDLPHRRLLERLAPALVDVPFADGGSWPEWRGRAGARVERGSVLAGKASVAARRSARAQVAAARAAVAGVRRRGRASAGAVPAVAGSDPRPVARGAGGEDPWARVHALTREIVLEQPEHPAWPVLDRGRVEGLLQGPPGALDTMGRYYVWRLLGVFTPGATAGP